LPAKSLADALILAQNVVEGARLGAGVNVAVLPVSETVPVTPPTVKLDVSIVARSMASENVAEMVPFGATFVAPLAGVVEMTRGGIVSSAGGGVVSSVSTGSVPLSQARIAIPIAQEQSSSNLGMVVDPGGEDR
jgi:hypothetical protein